MATEPTAEEKTSAKISVEEWNEYSTRWQQPIKRWAEGINKDKTPEMAQATGITNADLSQRSAKMERGMAASGFNPNSGKMIAAVNSANDTMGLVSAGAKVRARQGVEDARLQGLQQVANIGMGQKADAINGINQIAQQSVSKAIGDARNSQNEQFAKNNMIGSFAGMAAGVGMEAYDAGAFSDGSLVNMDATSRQAVIDGASSGPGGYSVTGNLINWNKVKR